MSTSFKSGQLLGRYELLLPLARGGMAEVWAARLHGTRGFQKLVAIKTMLPGVIEDERADQMFMEEAGLACRIQHPNVVHTIELGEDNNALYLVMEWIDGEPLNAVIKRAPQHSPMPLNVAVNLTSQCCKGLQAAHDLKGSDGAPLGVVHRDVSPHNILVSYTGTAKIVDFGIAKVTSQAASLTEVGEVKGKIAYMSPEQISGEPVDRRSDVFSLGIVLYQLSTGKHPFKGESTGETIKNTMDCRPTPPSKLVPGFPTQLEYIVNKALCFDPNERYSTARELLLDLRNALPAAVDHGADAETARYVTELFGERIDQKKQALRSAMAMSRFDPAGVTSSISVASQSGTMGAVTSDDAGSYEQISQLLKQNSAASRRHAFVGGGAAVVIALGVGFVVKTSASDPGIGGASSAVAAGAVQGLPRASYVLPTRPEPLNDPAATAASTADPVEPIPGTSASNRLAGDAEPLATPSSDGAANSDAEAGATPPELAQPKRIKRRRWRRVNSVTRAKEVRKSEVPVVQKSVLAPASAKGENASASGGNSAPTSAPNIDDRNNFGGRW